MISLKISFFEPTHAAVTDNPDDVLMKDATIVIMMKNYELYELILLSNLPKKTAISCGEFPFNKLNKFSRVIILNKGSTSHWILTAEYRPVRLKLDTCPVHAFDCLTYDVLLSWRPIDIATTISRS